MKYSKLTQSHSKKQITSLKWEIDLNRQFLKNKDLENTLNINYQRNANQATVCYDFNIVSLVVTKKDKW